MHAQISVDNFVAYRPEGEDGTTKYPQFHRLMGKTKYGKVVDVVIPPGTSEAPHTHFLYSVMFTDQPTAITVHHVAQQGFEKLVYSDQGAASPPLRPAISMMEPEPYHYVRNCDPARPYRAIRIELKCKGSPSPDMQGDMKVQGALRNENNLVKLWDIALNPGRSLSLESNGRPGFLVSDLQSTVNIWKNDGPNEMEIVRPYDKPNGETAERPKVWAVNKRSQYKLLNGSDRIQRVYCLEIKA